mgnify:FL=1
MKQAELYKALKSIGLPIKYHHFTEPPLPPYLVYLCSYSSDLVADNTNYVDIENFQIELYTDKKDLASEKLVQDKLKELELPYSKTEYWIESEKLYQVIYEVQLI